MDLEIIILSDASQTKTNTMWYQLNVKSKKKGVNELIYTKEIDPKTENKPMLIEGEREGGIN